MKQRVIVLASIILLMGSGIVSAAIGQTASQSSAQYPIYDDTSFAALKYSLWYELLSELGVGPVEAIVSQKEILVEEAVVTKEHIEEEDNLLLGISVGQPALGLIMSNDESFRVKFSGAVPFSVSNKTLFDSLKDGEKVQVRYSVDYFRSFYNRECLKSSFDKNECLLYRTNEKHSPGFIGLKQLK